MVDVKAFCIRMSALLLLTVLMSQCSQSARSPTERECNQIGTVLRNKTFTYPWWDHSLAMASGSSSGCPVRGKAVKCCPSTFDTPIHRREMSNSVTQKWLGSKLIAAKEIFGERKKKFDVTFKALLVRAHTSFHAMFERTYGMLYIQHADVFHALFKTLEKYYDDGRDHLESKLNEFFAILTRKMFEVLNAQYDFTEAYLSCATIVISEKQGNELHRQIVSSLRRSFVATRAFAQGLIEAERIISNVNKIQLDTTNCLIPVSQMLTCPICVESRAYKPCLPFCTAVTVKCLSSTFHLAKPWNEFSRALEDLTDRLMGPYNVEAVVEPIHIKISEAIMNFQESGADLSQAVFSKCGKPTLKSRTFDKREAVAERRIQATSRRVPEKDDLQPSKSLEKLLRETKNRVKKSRELWNVLPKQVCNAISKDYSSQQCWNGSSTVKLEKRKNVSKDSDGGEDGSSLTLDTQPQGRPTPLISEQILLLQLITDKLKTAFNGGDVQWIQELDTDDEFGSGMEMGSGSGEIPTDLEDTDDDDPGGEVHKTQRPPQVSTELNFVTKKVVTTPEKPFHPNPTYEEPTRITPPSSNRPIIPDVHVSEDQEEEDDDDETSNLNINSNGNNNRPGSPAGNDFGVDLPPILESPGRIPFFPAVPPQAPTTTSTASPPTPTTTTTTRKPSIITIKPRKDPPAIVTPAPTPVLKPEIPGAKTVAVVNVFTPVIMSMLQKLFNAG